MEVLCEFVKKLEVIPCVLGLLLSFLALYFKVSLLFSIIIFLSVYIIYEIVVKLNEKIKVKKEIKRNRIRKHEESIREYKEKNTEILRIFRCLSDFNLKWLKEMYNEKYDFNDIYVRIIKDPYYNNHFFELEQLSNIFSRPINNSLYREFFLWVSECDGSLMIKFDPYLYSLIENYARTSNMDKI